MAAYTAVISLLQTLQLFNVHTSQPFDSLYATAQYFQHLLQNNSGFDTEKIRSLEEKIRDAASEAEDVVELKISQIIKVSGWRFGTGKFQHQDLLPVVKKMDKIKNQVMEIVSHDQVLELSGDSSIGTSSASYPTLEDDIVHGLDDDLEIIVERLKGCPRDLDVVTISGMGGIGKTTLARKAYHHQRIRYHFDVLAWVTISQEFRFRNILLELLHCISKKTDIVNSKDYDKMDDNELADVVQKSLKGRRHLVVVDDIWSTDVWDGIRGIFPDYNNGSRILLTTRENEVAMYANTCSPHEMSLLSLENGWRLLCDKVFGPKYEHPPELEEIGMEIVEKCQGLPLTISVIAGHLSKVAKTLQGWKDVARNLTEIIASHPDKCLEVLGLSYHHLPSHLKPCFLSMSSFPEDFQVDTRRLIQLWIAEGFIRTSENGKSLAEVAEHYFEDLISRNLIQARKRRFNGEIKECGIHDLLREFCLIEAEMTKHMHVQKTRPILPTQKHNFRLFSFQTESYSVDDCCKLLPPVARSIHLFSRLDLPFEKSRELAIHEFFSHFNLLRVLAIFNTRVWFESFPLVIIKLFHLRYLQVEFNGDIPESISHLQNLQTLICPGICSLPGKIWTMKNLRYLHTKRPSYLPSPRTEHLVTGMQNLEEFSVLSVISCTNEVFCGIPNLKRLSIRLPLFFNQPCPWIFDMSRLTKLEAFKLYWSVGMVDSIKRFVFPTSLRRLSIKWFRYFDWADISSTVMMLPNLEELKLKSCVAKDVWRTSVKYKFKSLKLFLLDNVDLVHWEASSDNFPNLKRLVLKRCRWLKEIPADFGEICTLESIELHDCHNSAEESARKIEQEQQEMGNNSLKIYIHNRCGTAAFDTEYGQWEEGQNSHTNDLRNALHNSQISEAELRSIVYGCLNHYFDLFRVKATAAKADVLYIMSGMWKTSVERFFMWIGGFRTSELLKTLFLQVLTPHLELLTEQQLREVCNLLQSCQQAEDALSQGMVKLHQILAETVAAGRLGEGNYSLPQMVPAIEKLEALVRFVNQADHLRQETLQQMSCILNTHQAAQGLLALGQYFAWLRALSSIWATRLPDS